MISTSTPLTRVKEEAGKHTWLTSVDREARVGKTEKGAGELDVRVCRELNTHWTLFAWKGEGEFRGPLVGLSNPHWSSVSEASRTFVHAVASTWVVLYGSCWLPLPMANFSSLSNCIRKPTFLEKHSPAPSWLGWTARVQAHHFASRLSQHCN